MRNSETPAQEKESAKINQLPGTVAGVERGRKNSEQMLDWQETKQYLCPHTQKTS